MRLEAILVGALVAQGLGLIVLACCVTGSPPEWAFWVIVAPTALVAFAAFYLKIDDLDNGPHSLWGRWWGSDA